MAKYKINYQELEDADLATLIEAVQRYLNVEKFPNTDVIAGILCINRAEEEKKDGE